MTFREIWPVTWPLLVAASFLWRYRTRREWGVLLVAGLFAAASVATLLVELFFLR
jgi:hypothetical protein